MIRSRDIFACIIVVLLTSAAWNQDGQSVSVNLRWFTGHATRAFDTLDVDGDGTAETIIVVTPTESADKSSGKFKLQLLDLRFTSKVGGVITQPPVVLESAPVDLEAETVTPMRLVTGQVMMKAKKKEEAVQVPSEPSDRTRHYFCGFDWHDASAKCGVPCPTGQTSDCPEGEKCYADTPCDSKAKKVEDQLLISTNLHLTPANSLPSIYTLWSSGEVTMHSLTGDKEDKTKKQPLELRQMWRVRPLPNKTIVSWDEARLLFVDELTVDNGAGMVLVSGTVEEKRGTGAEQEFWETAFVTALHARTGEVMWYNIVDEEPDVPADVPLPYNRGATSAARRRSNVPNLHLDPSDRSTVFPADCMHMYRRSMLTGAALPFLYWSEADAAMKLSHFEYSQQNSKKSSPHEQRRRRNSKKKHPVQGRPNVVVTHQRDGVLVRSLKNGRSVCHLSLWYETLYADFNHDGVLDSVQMVLGDHSYSEQAPDDDNEKFVNALASRFGGGTGSSPKYVNGTLEVPGLQANLCHALVLSGLPSREELFAINLCGSKKEREMYPPDKLEAAPPLAVEAMHRKNGYDLMLAVSSGIVRRVSGRNGRRQWRTNGRNYPDFPKWDYDAVVSLSRIDSPNVVPGMRPVLLAGENSLAILSAQHGSVLAVAPFPQQSRKRPVLVDFSGDGTTDVIVVTDDALWGYQVIVKTGASIFYRIIVGLLFMGILLAILRNRFGPQPGKRSTDL